MEYTGINNINEYYTNHYFATFFEDNAKETVSAWNEKAKADGTRAPWSQLRDTARGYSVLRDRFLRTRSRVQQEQLTTESAEQILEAMGYKEASPEWREIDDTLSAPVYMEYRKPNGAPLLWVMLGLTEEPEDDILSGTAFIGEGYAGTEENDSLAAQPDNETLITKALFHAAEPPRFLLLIGIRQIALIDRNKWNEKRYLSFDLDDVFGRREDHTLKAFSVLLHHDSLCPAEGNALLDTFDETSQRNASGVSKDLKYALRESIELLGNEVLYDMRTRQNKSKEADSIDAGELTLECLRYMYRMLFVLFIESRPELGFAPMKSQVYFSAYSLESLRDIAEKARDDIDEIGEGYFLFETLEKLYGLIYNGYPETDEELKRLAQSESVRDLFLVPPLKAHIFDPERTKHITEAKIRNSVMLRIIDLMSVTRVGDRNSRRGRISYANLGINQMGSVYEALLSYRGFIAWTDLYEVKPAKSKFDELEVGYFVPEEELDQYTKDERVRFEDGPYKGQPRFHKKGSFIYRLAGREREKSASYYTPESLTKCLVKYALQELLEGKTADEILKLTVCEPAMGSAAFLNEAINQLAEAYLDRKQKETGDSISHEDRFMELQKVKMFIADRNVYGIDLNPIAVELAEVSLWLNTIYEGGYVPWFGTQLTCGNSLIGARRQCYHKDSLQVSANGLHWYENAPERVPVGTKRGVRTQVYHFLLGDPGMSNYTDKVIKGLEPDKIKTITAWNRQFIQPVTDDDLKTMLKLSAQIDVLWDEVVKLRNSIEEQTADALSVYGHIEEEGKKHTTIREKDRIFSERFLSEQMKNAGPYARLKFAMDYWCALWFWPIAEADQLPTRSEFLFEMSLILEGTYANVVGISKATKEGQMSFFDDEYEQLAFDFLQGYEQGEVDIPLLCSMYPRLELVRKIAAQNHFMHWELEFANLFAEKGGFDLIIGNPPWIRLEWIEQNVLSEAFPIFAIKKMTGPETALKRKDALQKESVYTMFFSEYEAISGQQLFLNAIGNYSELRGQQPNIYKCFIPQAWKYCNSVGFSAYLHPEGIYDDPKADQFREMLYPKLRLHFQFQNEKKLFAEVANRAVYSLNVYSNKETASFDSISNLFLPSTIDECYDSDGTNEVGGIKDDSDNWNIYGHKERIIKIGKDELNMFAKFFDQGGDWRRARIPVLHARQLVDVLLCFSNGKTVQAFSKKLCMARIWDETGAQNDGFIVHKEHFPKSPKDLIYSGPHIGVANPLFQGSQRVCNTHRAYENIDLTSIADSFLQRCKYAPNCSETQFFDQMPINAWGTKASSDYRIILRNMFNQSGERTLIPAIAPKYATHIHPVFGISSSDKGFIALLAGSMASLVSDFYIKVTGKASCGIDLINSLVVPDGKMNGRIIQLCLMLNCLNDYYSDLWKTLFTEEYKTLSWAKIDKRLRREKFAVLTPNWCWETPFRYDYERRQAMLELDVLMAMSLGMTLDQLKTIYRIQFPVLHAYEADTWYDANGRIVFTNNRSLTGVGFSRPEWENANAVRPLRRGEAEWNGVMKDAPAGYVFARTITDDTMPGGPVERTIEYVAPFDRCDREQDYETAWKFFEKLYRN